MISRDLSIGRALRARQRGFLLNPFRFGGGGVGPTDPSFANVRLLLHFDGADGATTFTDSSASPKAATVSGNAKLSTAQSKFGPSSGFFDGTGDFVRFGSASDFHINNFDFTIEAWIYMTLDGSRQKTILATRAVVSLTQGYEFVVTSTGALRFSAYLSDAFPINVLSANGVVTANVWRHVAVSRVGANTRLFVDGVQVGIDTSSGNIGQGTNLYVGRLTTISTGVDWQGYIDELRVTIGVGRYAAAFTPPAAAFPNS